ncbi:uncharacterized protein LOC135503603 isoform X1 [Lineus longissimus]|uniref:uncharacterized protein LOC135503603 isoform X1 n=1 Tax=Lineus longissimus TaxID=88925 RepID=UPI00315DDF7D
MQRLLELLLFMVLQATRWRFGHSIGYKLTIITSKDPGSATAGNISVMVSGLKNSSTTWELLKRTPTSFQEGSVDVFEVGDTKFGMVRQLQLLLQNNYVWTLDKMYIENPDTGKKSEFNCSCRFRWPNLIKHYFVKIDGGWSAWSAWAVCGTNCGTCPTTCPATHITVGTSRSRTRTCDNPLPDNGGDACKGADRDYNCTLCIDNRTTTTSIPPTTTTTTAKTTTKLTTTTTTTTTTTITTTTTVSPTTEMVTSAGPVSSTSASTPTVPTTIASSAIPPSISTPSYSISTTPSISSTVACGAGTCDSSTTTQPFTTQPSTTITTQKPLPSQRPGETGSSSNSWETTGIPIVSVIVAILVVFIIILVVGCLIKRQQKNRIEANSGAQGEGGGEEDNPDGEAPEKPPSVPPPDDLEDDSGAPPQGGWMANGGHAIAHSNSKPPNGDIRRKGDPEPTLPNAVIDLEEPDDSSTTLHTLCPVEKTAASGAWPQYYPLIYRTFTPHTISLPGNQIVKGGSMSETKDIALCSMV